MRTLFLIFLSIYFFSNGLYGQAYGIFRYQYKGVIKSKNLIAKQIKLPTIDSLAGIDYKHQFVKGGIVRSKIDVWVARAGCSFYRSNTQYVIDSVFKKDRKFFPIHLYIKVKKQKELKLLEVSIPIEKIIFINNGWQKPRIIIDLGEIRI